MTNFTFNLERMCKAVESPRIKVPASALSTDEDFEEWLNADTDFINFDLQRMRKAVESPSHAMPDAIKTLEEFDDWLNSTISPPPTTKHLTNQ